MTVEEFSDMLGDIMDEIPDEFYHELNGGVILKEEIKFHPQSIGEDLCIMGEYHTSTSMGRYIFIYYGSFMRVHGFRPYEELRHEVKHTLIHEFRHHLESLAGYRDLEVEDEVSINTYLQAKRPPDAE